MNEIKIFLKEGGSIAELYKDFNLYKGAYRNAQISVYVPKSLLYTIPAANIAPAVKTGAILTAPNGSKVTTDSHGADYVKDETVGNVAYSVFTQILPKEYCLYSGTQTLVVNVVNVDGTNASAPAAVSVITSQTAQISVQESAYVADEQILDPTQAEAIQAQQTAQDVKIAQNAASINELQSAETSNSEKISQNTSDIAELQARAETGTTYIGQMEGVALPEAEALNAFVVANTDPAREPASGDTIVFLLDSGDAQTAYKYTYGTSGWSGYVMPPVQAASNGVPGVVEGTYGTDSENAVLLDIAGGKVQDIYFKDESGAYKSFSESINGVLKNISGFLSGELAAAVANKAVRDRNGDIIDITYLTQAEGATKGFVTDYALPKQFGNVNYISSDGYVSEVPVSESGVQFSVNTASTGTVELFELVMQLSDAYELTKNNFTTNIIWIEALSGDSASFRLVTQAKKAADSTWRTLSRQESGELPLEAGTPSKVTFYSNFSELAENVLSLESGDAIRQLLQVKPGSNKSNTYYVISNQLYPSLFTFNTNTMLISSENLVTTNTAQAIEGAKTFTSPIRVSLTSSVAGVTVIYSGGAISVYPDKISVLTPQGATYSFTFPAESGTLCLSEDLAATLQQAQEAVAAAQAAQAAAESARDEAKELLEGKIENLSVETLHIGDVELTGTSDGILWSDIAVGGEMNGATLHFNTSTDIPYEDFPSDSDEILITFENGYKLAVRSQAQGAEIAMLDAGGSVAGSVIYMADGGWTDGLYDFSNAEADSLIVQSMETEETAVSAAAKKFISAVIKTDITLNVDGNISVGNNAIYSSKSPTNANELTRKAYVDSQDTALQNSKYDKTGGTISGDVVVTGDLTVQGTTTTNDAETLQVKDNYIVTNSDGATLAGYSGILIRTNSTVTYGIAYDPGSNAVLLGHGVYNADNGTFSFNSGEGLPVAVRAVSTAWTNGHIAVWSSTNNQFIDGGNLISDLLLKAGAAQTVSSQINFTAQILADSGIRFGVVTNVSENTSAQGTVNLQLPPASGTIARIEDIPEITVDSALSNTSTNPVQNKVISEALGNKQDALTAGDGISIQGNVISTDLQWATNEEIDALFA